LFHDESDDKSGDEDMAIEDKISVGEDTKSVSVITVDEMAVGDEDMEMDPNDHTDWKSAENDERLLLI